MTSPRNRRPVRLSVQTSFRVFLYTGFSACVVSTIALLGWGGSWIAPMFGTVAFGIPAIMAYLTEQEHQQNIATVRATQKAMRGGGGWDLEDDEEDGGDPTVPPAPRERNR
jgi:hypothetical protein